MTRRTALASLAGLAVSAIGARETAKSPAAPASFGDELPGAERKKKLKVIHIGAHVDDYVDCAGTLIRYGQAGHDVLCISLTPGDSKGMADSAKMPLERLAALRREHAIDGCNLIGAKFTAWTQSNQNMRVDPEVQQAFNEAYMGENPDIIFTNWLVQYHPDHRAAGNIAMQYWMQGGVKASLYFVESIGGYMSAQLFPVNRFVDISAVAEKKREVILANKSIASYADKSDVWDKQRGMMYGCKSAEAFVHMNTVAQAYEINLYPNKWHQSGLKNR